MARKIRRRKKICIFCAHNFEPHYKNDEVIKRMVTERGKILPRRMSGTCAKHQRHVAVVVKRARQIALLPFVAENLN